MKKITRILTGLLPAALASTTALATNGDNLIGVGAISRGMGGVGIANPLDAVSAVFANPAAMCFGPVCDISEFDFAGTMFMPKVNASVDLPGLAKFSADSENYVYPIPAIGISIPLDAAKRWRFGLAAYGVTGLGVDYRDTALDQSLKTGLPAPAPAEVPLIAGEYTSFQIMKFAPSVAYQVTDQLSVGLAVPLDYATLDLHNGSAPGYSIGVQPGIVYRPTPELSLGLIYVSPQPSTFDQVADFDGDGRSDNLKLEAPQQVGLGISYEFFDHTLTVAGDVKWLNWNNADGYDDFDWDNQWVFGIGAQYALIPGKLYLRAGYNYAKNPVNEHNNWAPTDTTTVQGKTMPTYYYETFRLVGFPAIVENHVTLGLGYEISKTVSLDLGFMYGFSNTISETGATPLGGAVTMKSELEEFGVDFGLKFRF
jgi:long-chain fatty acid transport protein